MSRLAKKPVPIPAGVAIDSGKDTVVVKGPKAELRIPLLSLINVTVDSKGVMVRTSSQERQARANQGTMWSLIRNAIVGVTEGFSKVLEIEGVGYRAQMEGTTLVLALGYVNPVRVQIPSGLGVTVEKGIITLTGSDKELVGRIASEIRALKKPEPYKGKGIHYRGEVIRRKAGKKAVATAG